MNMPHYRKLILRACLALTNRWRERYKRIVCYHTSHRIPCKILKQKKKPGKLLYGWREYCMLYKKTAQFSVFPHLLRWFCAALVQVMLSRELTEYKSPQSHKDKSIFQHLPHQWSQSYYVYISLIYLTKWKIQPWFKLKRMRQQRNRFIFYAAWAIYLLVQVSLFLSQ